MFSMLTKRSRSASSRDLYHLLWSETCQPWSATSAVNSHPSVTRRALCLFLAAGASVSRPLILFSAASESTVPISSRIRPGNGLWCILWRGVRFVCVLFCFNELLMSLPPQLRVTWRPTSTRANWCRRTFRWPRNYRRRRTSGPKYKPRNSTMTCRWQPDRLTHTHTHNSGH